MKSKDIIISLGLIIGLAIPLYSYTNPKDKIIGKWVSQSDSKTEWVFSNTTCYWYYNGKLVDSFTFKIDDLSSKDASTSKSFCGYVVRTGHKEDFYLEIRNKSADLYCY